MLRVENERNLGSKQNLNLITTPIDIVSVVGCTWIRLAQNLYPALGEADDDDDPSTTVCTD